MSLGMSAQMLGSHGTVGAVRAVQPARADVMFMFEVGMEVVSSLGLKVAERAVYPVDVDAVLGGEVHGEVLFGFASKVTMRTAKVRCRFVRHVAAARATWWRCCAPAAGRTGT